MTLPPSGIVARKAAGDAFANVGVAESGGNNRGRWVETYQEFTGAPAGSPWCASFVAYRYHTAAKELMRRLPDRFPRSAWVPDYVAWARSNDLWIPVHQAEDSMRGDLVVFWMPKLKRHAHIGIARAPATGGRVNGLTVDTVEGNTSPGTGAVNRDGDGVYARARHVSELGRFGGFIRVPDNY